MEGGEAPIITASELDFFIRHLKEGDYSKAEVTKHSQEQLFQGIFSVLPFFPPQLSHSELFTNNPPKAQTTVS